MIETTIYDYLVSELASVPVYMTRPETAPQKYVLIEKTGGSASNHVYKSMFAFQSYGATLLEAAQLNETVKEAVEELVTLDEVASARYQTDYNFTNVADKHPRYQAIFEITHY